MKPILSLDGESKFEKLETDETETSIKIPDFEQLVTYLGHFGDYQKWLYFFLWIPAGAMSIAIYASVFLEFVPNHHCASTCHDQSHMDWFSNHSCTIPKSWNESCQVETVADPLNAVECPSGYAYDQNIFTSTVVTDFGAVCGNAYLRTISSTVYMSGMLFGSLFFGWISDAMGRRFAFGLCISCISVGSILAAASTNYAMYMVFRFITSMGGVGSFMTCFVLATEFVGTKYRTACGILIEIPFALGELYIVLLAYYIRDWSKLQLAIGVPFLVLFLYLFKLPESVRWSWAVGKFKTANKVILEMSRFNKVEVPKEFIMSEDVEMHQWTTEGVGMAPLLASKQLRGRLIVMAFNWIVATLCFYGLSLNAGIGSNVFSAFSLSAAMEIPAYIFSALSIDVLGRKPFLMFVQILCGISCICAGLISDANLRLLFSLVGKFGSSAAFSAVFLYTAELFPTSMRNSAVGMCSTLARFGGILAPTVAQLGYYRPDIPFLIFGVATLIGGLSAYLLPETKGKKLPDTVQEALAMVDDENATMKN